MQSLRNNIIRDEIEKIIIKIKDRSPKNTLLNLLENYYKTLFCKEKSSSSVIIKEVISVLSEESLRKKRIDYLHLRTLAKPYMDNISIIFQEHKHIVILADSDGYILDVIGTKDKFSTNKLGLIEGACLSEESVGVNGVGTALKKGEPVLIYGNEHSNSEYNNLICYGVPIRDNQDQIIGVLELTTPKKSVNPDRFTLVLLSVSSIETALTQIAADRAEERVKNMSNIVATSVHDLKNPLSIIQALTKLGNKRAESAQSKEYFNRINKQTKQLTSLLNNILLVSEPEEFSFLSPSKILNNVIDDLRPLADTHNIKIDYKNNNKVKIRIRKKVFARAMYNIIINAIHCIEGDGYITVNILDELKNILIKVEDNGPGVSEDIRDNLFQAFISKRDGGTGLGLYMVYQTITHVHQGKIWFETKKNVGTTFYITIPYPDYCVI